MINVMIFAAGLGTRLRPLTNDRPKALVEINGITLLEHTIRRISSLNVAKLVINVHHYADKIERFLKDHQYFGMNIEISDERDVLLNTGGGLKKAASLFLPDLPILIYNVDVISDIDLSTLIETHLKTNALATLVVRKRKTARYLLFNSENQLCGWKNVDTGEIREALPTLKEPDALAFSGIHVVNPSIFSEIDESGSFSIIDLYLRLAGNHRVLAYRDKSDIWIDLGKLEQLKKTEIWLKKQNQKK